MSTTARPTTCGETFAVDPTLGAKGCRRLPRHGGDHRSYLTRRGEAKALRAKTVKAAAKSPKAKATKSPKGTKAALNSIVRDIRTQIGQPRGRLNAAKRREGLALLSVAVDAGVLTAGDALGLVTKF
jgi:hypothetical protein